MRSIVAAQWRRLLRNPYYLLIMVGLSVGIALVVGGQSQNTIRVGVIADQAMTETEVAEWMDVLGRADGFRFVLGDEDSVLNDLSGGSTGLAVRLRADGWEVIAGQNEANTPLLSYYMGTVYREELTLRAAAAGQELDALRQAVEARTADPVLRVRAMNEGADEAREQGFSYDSRVQGLLGMGLLFAMFTMLSGVHNILEDRRLGVWNRVIVSPTSRFSMYWGHLSFAFVQGFAQVGLVFTLFHYAFGVRIGEAPLLTALVIAAFTFATVALGLLIAGLVSNAQQMGVAIPIVAVSSAMLAGAYWPREIVTNQFLLGASNFVPLTYAFESFKGLAYYGYGLPDLLPNLAMLLLFGVLCMGIGMRLVDRRGG